MVSMKIIKLIFPVAAGLMALTLNARAMTNVQMIELQRILDLNTIDIEEKMELAADKRLPAADREEATIKTLQDFYAAKVQVINKAYAATLKARND